MQNQHQKIKGYRDLSQEEIDLMNRIKEKGAELLALQAELTGRLDTDSEVKFSNARKSIEGHQFVPERYKTNIGKVTVELDVQTSPELQQTIDEAKAECEKAVAERDDALEQLQTVKGEFITFYNNIDAMKARITELEANADKTDEEKPKTTKAK